MLACHAAATLRRVEQPTPEGARRRTEPDYSHALEYDRVVEPGRRSKSISRARRSRGTALHIDLLHRPALRRPYQWSNTDDFSAMKVPFTSIQIPRRLMTYVL